MNLQKETRDAIASVPAGSVSAQSMRIGVANNEPLLVCLDGLLRYAKAYEKIDVSAPANEENTEYLRIAEREADGHDVIGYVGKFAETFGLKDKKVLDIGAGRG